MQKLYKNIPETPGVYIMKDAHGLVLYIGKAANLKRRVSSYFMRPPSSNQNLRAGKHDTRIQKMVSGIARIDIKETDSALEALILESKLIKQYQPPFNIQEKDDKSFLYVAFTNEEFPRVLLIRGKDMQTSEDIYQYAAGPFVSASSVREALRIIRKIFPWNDHQKVIANNTNKTNNANKPCFNYQIGLCPGTCIGKISKKEYAQAVKNIILFFQGKKEKIVKNLEKEMNTASKRLEFERAEKIRRQVFALSHINDTALLKNEDAPAYDQPASGGKRIEGYDISNISGTNSVGVMIVFSNNKPEKSEYRKFHIKTVEGQNDTGMLKEVVKRRFHNSWKRPDLILVDGGLGQVNIVKDVLKEIHILVPVIGMAKGVKRKRTDIIGEKPLWVSLQTLIRVRDEAHRFAIAFHRKKRRAGFLKKS